MENNFTVIRAFAFVVQEGYNMQLGDGAYNVSLLEAMDQFVAASSTRGLKLIMSLSNNWNYNSNMSDTKCAPAHSLLRLKVACKWLCMSVLAKFTHASAVGGYLQKHAGQAGQHIPGSD